MNRVLRQLGVEDFGEFGIHLESRLFRYRVKQDGPFINVVVWNGDATEDKVLGSDIPSLVSIENEFLKVTDYLGRLNFDRQRGQLTVNKTGQAQEIVGHGVAKH